MLLWFPHAGSVDIPVSIAGTRMSLLPIGENSFKHCYNDSRQIGLNPILDPFHPH